MLPSFLGSVILQANDVTLYVEIFFIIILLIIFLALFASSIKIVREYERVVQFRLGRLTGSRGPGIVLILPVINRLVKVDLRERYLEVLHQTAITKDNAPVDIDFLIYYKVVDASASIVQVQNFTGASVGLATTTLRAVVGDIPLDELLSKREQINSILRTRLDEVTEMGNQSHQRRDPRDPTTQRRPGRNGQTNDRREKQASSGHRIRRYPGILRSQSRRSEERGHTASGGAKAVRDPRSRREQTVSGPRSGWLCTSFGSHLLRCQEHRLENNGPPIPRHAQGAGRRRIDKVHPTDGVHKHDFQTERICSGFREGLEWSTDAKYHEVYILNLKLLS